MELFHFRNFWFNELSITESYFNMVAKVKKAGSLAWYQTIALLATTWS